MWQVARVLAQTASDWSEARHDRGAEECSAHSEICPSKDDVIEHRVRRVAAVEGGRNDLTSSFTRCRPKRRRRVAQLGGPQAGTHLPASDAWYITDLEKTAPRRSHPCVRCLRAEG